MNYLRTDTVETTIGKVTVRELSRAEIFRIDRIQGMKEGDEKEDATEKLDEDLVTNCVLEWPAEPPENVIQDVPHSAFKVIIDKLMVFSGIREEPKPTTEAAANLPEAPSV